jgi:hypothetical protein
MLHHYATYAIKNECKVFALDGLFFLWNAAKTMALKLLVGIVLIQA